MSTSTETFRTAPEAPEHNPDRWQDDKAGWNERNPLLFYRDSGEMAGGIRVPYGPRIPKMTYWEPETRGFLGTQEVPHAEILRLLSEYMDLLARYSKEDVDGTHYAVTLMAYEAVFEDLETGTSLATWPALRDIVDRAVTWSITADDKDVFVTIEWEVF